MAGLDPTCPVIKNLILLDSEGKRIAVKYYSNEWSTVASQANFEKSLWTKTSRTNARQEAEIVMLDNYIMVYKYLGDLMFYVTGSQDENELVLYTVLQAFYESVSLLLRQQVEKKTVLENLDLVLLAMDEIVDGGVILETDPQTIASRVTMRGADGELPMTEQQVAVQSFTKAFASAKEHLARSLLKLLVAVGMVNTLLPWEVKALYMLYVVGLFEVTSLPARLQYRCTGVWAVLGSNNSTHATRV